MSGKREIVCAQWRAKHIKVAQAYLRSPRAEEWYSLTGQNPPWPLFDLWAWWANYVGIPSEDIANGDFTPTDIMNRLRALKEKERRELKHAKKVGLLKQGAIKQPKSKATAIVQENAWKPKWLIANAPQYFRPGMIPVEYVVEEASRLVPIMREMQSFLEASDLDTASAFLSRAFPGMFPHRLLYDNEGKYLGEKGDRVERKLGTITRLHNVLEKDIKGRKPLSDHLDWFEQAKALNHKAGELILQVRKARESKVGDRELRRLCKTLVAGFRSNAEGFDRFALAHRRKAVEQSKPSRHARRGRKKQNADVTKNQLATLEMWAKAKTAGVSRKDFCKDNGITVRDLEKCRDTQYQRQRRAK